MSNKKQKREKIEIVLPLGGNVNYMEHALHLEYHEPTQALRAFYAEYDDTLEIDVMVFRDGVLEACRNKVREEFGALAFIPRPFRDFATSKAHLTFGIHGSMISTHVLREDGMRELNAFIERAVSAYEEDTAQERETAATEPPPAKAVGVASVGVAMSPCGFVIGADTNPPERCLAFRFLTADKLHFSFDGPGAVVSPAEVIAAIDRAIGLAEEHGQATSFVEMPDTGHANAALAIHIRKYDAQVNATTPLRTVGINITRTTLDRLREFIKAGPVARVFVHELAAASNLAEAHRETEELRSENEELRDRLELATTYARHLVDLADKMTEGTKIKPYAGDLSKAEEAATRIGRAWDAAKEREERVRFMSKAERDEVSAEIGTLKQELEKTKGVLATADMNHAATKSSLQRVSQDRTLIANTLLSIEEGLCTAWGIARQSGSVAQDRTDPADRARAIGQTRLVQTARAQAAAFKDMAEDRERWQAEAQRISKELCEKRAAVDVMQRALGQIDHGVATISGDRIELDTYSDPTPLVERVLGKVARLMVDLAGVG